jgi:hypothetical protein
MKITGSCFCGAVGYEAEIDEQRVGACHCRDCQIFSGSAFRLAAFVKPEDFRFTHGMPKYFDKTAASGNVRRMAFCGDCGTHLSASPVEGSSGFVSVRIASANEFHELRPTAEVFCDSAVSWLAPLEGTVRFPRMPS